MIPKISVIMPIYGHEEYLHEAVQSILYQTFQDFELLAICDPGQPNLPLVIGILNWFRDKRIHVIIPGKHMTVAEAMNFAMPLVRGDYIARMDSDDVSLPDRFEKQISFLGRHPEIGAVGGQIKYIDEGGEGLDREIRLPISSFRIIAAFPRYNPIANSTTMIRDSVFQSVPSDPKFKVAEDYDYWIRVSFETKIRNLPDILVRYRIHKKNASTDSAAWANLVQKKHFGSGVLEKTVAWILKYALKGEQNVR